MAKRVSSLGTVSFSGFLEKNDPSLKARFDQEYGDIYFHMLGNLVNFHKNRLGKQSFCFTSERRYWVWEKSRWCVYVNNHTGVQFEVDPACTVKEAWGLWASFRKTVSNSQDNS